MNHSSKFYFFILSIGCIFYTNSFAQIDSFSLNPDLPSAFSSDNNDKRIFIAFSHNGYSTKTPHSECFKKSAYPSKEETCDIEQRLFPSDSDFLDASSKTDEEEKIILWILLLKEICDSSLPGFKETSAIKYAPWEKLHADFIATIRANPDFQSALTKIRVTNTSAVIEIEEKKKIEKSCNDLISDLEKGVHPPYPQ